jgi:hypothetical protein
MVKRIVSSIVYGLVLFGLLCSALAESSKSRLEDKITLERSMCYGDCPVYKVEIFEDGRTVFSSDKRYGDNYEDVNKFFAYPRGVLLPGIHEDRISSEVVGKLFAKFTSAKFFGLRKHYVAQVTDNPFYTLTLQIGGRKKEVVDYVGRAVGMPEVVTQLEEAVDAAAKSNRWVSGTTDLLPWLEKQHFDFHSPEAGQLVAAAAGSASSSEDLVIELIRKGPPLLGLYKQPRRYIRQGEDWVVKTPVSQAIMEGAIATGKVRVFESIAKSGVFKTLNLEKASQIFAEHGAACSPKLVDTLFAVGLKIDAATPHDPKESEHFVYSKTALSEVVSVYGACIDHERDRVPTVQKLVRLGADINHRNSYGETPIFHVVSTPALKALIDLGADVNAVNKRGGSALSGVESDDAAFLLLKAGASPAGRNYDCETLWGRVNRYSGMPKLKKWLVAHQSTWKNKPETLKPCTPLNF